MTEEFDRVVGRLANHVAHWTPPRWAASSASRPGSRADAMFALVQQIANLAATAEGQPLRRVPRLDNDLALADQLRVVAGDLAATRDADAIRAATAMIAALNASI
jgi:hypothetical protein